MVASDDFQKDPDEELLLTPEQTISALKEANTNYKPSREHYLVLNSDIELRALLKAQLAKVTPIIAEAWDLQDTLLNLTVLNQNAPKIVLTNDECGWSITYYPDPPFTEGEISLMKGNPLEAVRALKQALKSS